jgi:hypothetical protein
MAALRFDGPGWVVAAAFLAFALILLFRVKSGGRALLLWLAVFGAVLFWWFGLQPSNNRNWQPDVDRTASAEIDGSRVTIHNVRNCDYRSETDFTPRWETRIVDSTRLQAADIFITHWGPALMAHPIVSFAFDDGQHVAFSVETRKEVGESYSAILGFFRRYELIYVVADERDVVRLRTNYRKGEDVCLYRLRATPELEQALWRGYLSHVNRLHERPEWYNAATTNCTTSIRSDLASARGGIAAPWDWRILANGYMDEMLYQRGELAGDLPFQELRRRADIDEAAMAADQDPDFSRRIREGRPGFVLSSR